MTLDVSLHHHTIIKGKDKSNVNRIRTVTGATIEIPIDRNTIFIRGQLESVLKARSMLLVIGIILKSC